MEKNSFLFYRSFYDAVRDLPNEQFANSVKGILAYAFEGIEYNGSDHIARVVYMLIKPIIDANNQRWENGKKGGRPKKQSETNKVSTSNQNKISVEPINNQDETEIEDESNQNQIKDNPPNNLDISKLIPTENQNETKTKPNFENSKPNIGSKIKEEGIGIGLKEKKSLSQKKESASAKKNELSDFENQASNEDFLSEIEKNEILIGEESASACEFEKKSLSLKKASSENFEKSEIEKNNFVTGKESARERENCRYAKNFENADNEAFNKAFNADFSEKFSEQQEGNDFVTGKERVRERENFRAPQNLQNAVNLNFTEEKIQNIDDIKKEFEATSHYEVLVMQRGINKQQARDALNIFVSDCKLRGDMMMGMREFRVRFSKLLPYLVKEIKANNKNSTNNIAKGW